MLSSERYYQIIGGLLLMMIAWFMSVILAWMQDDRELVMKAHERITALEERMIRLQERSK